MTTRAALENAVRDLWSDASINDSSRALSVATAAIGDEVWVWSKLSIAQLKTLQLGLLPMATATSPNSTRI